MEKTKAADKVIVLDTSIVGPLAIPDEQLGLDIDQVIALFEDGVVVPGHWRLEVANMMRTAVRKGRLAADARQDVLDLLTGLPIEIDPETWNHAWKATLVLSDRHGLTPYDAAYIELALRRGIGLATHDRALAKAARDEAVIVSSLL